MSRAVEFLFMARAWASTEIFPGGGKVDILLILFSLLAMQRKRTSEVYGV